MMQFEGISLWYEEIRADRVRRREVITLHATIESEQRDSRINVAHSRVNPAMLCSKSRQSWAELYAFE